MFLMHPSSLGMIMSDAKMPADEKRPTAKQLKAFSDLDHKIEADRKEYRIIANYSVLSAGAITYCNKLAKEFVYGYKAKLRSKYLDKGNICEDDSIRLYNDVFFCNHVKNTERRENEYLTGELDIYTGKKVIDIKTSWSLWTFPALQADAHDIDYEWQLRAYMMLWDVDYAELAFCMVNTPAELIGWEDESIHYVDHIDPQLRITRVQYERDAGLENKMKIKIGAAQAHIEETIGIITKEHT